MSDTKTTGLALLRVPFEARHISKLPKPTKAQTEAVKTDFKKGIRCQLCGAWHHPDVVHLDYVGHAALTDRLLDCDPAWNWEFAAVKPDGTPVLDSDGGMWIKLTVCGVTRLGYGDAQEKTGGNATKERIGDALRNAAMRFGAALDLWHKGDLHGEDAPDPTPKPKSVTKNEFDSMEPDQQQFLRNLAMDVMAGVDDMAIAAAYQKTKLTLDSDEQVAFWSLFDSKQRAAIKRGTEATK